MNIDTQGSCHFACSLTSFSNSLFRNSAEFCSAKETIRRPKAPLAPPAAWRPDLRQLPHFASPSYATGHPVYTSQLLREGRNVQMNAELGLHTNPVTTTTKSMMFQALRR